MSERDAITHGDSPSNGQATRLAEERIAAMARAGDAAAATPLGGRKVIGLLLTFLLLAIAWAHTFAEMWLRWFPGWNNPKLTSLSARLTSGDSYYTHAPLVALASLIMAVFIYKRVRLPAARTRAATALGWLLLAASLLMHVMSVYARVTFVSGFSLIGVLLGLLLIYGGWPLLRAYWLPVAFLVFMVPLPMETIASLNFRLKNNAASAALWLTTHVFGVAAVSDGSYVYLPPGADGLRKTLIVENVCGGLRSLISLIWFAALFAVVCRAKGPWRLFMLVMAVPVAIACNVARITWLNLVAHYAGVDAAGEGRPLHDYAGLMVFVLALAFLFGVERLILLVGRWRKRSWSDPRLLGFLDQLPRNTAPPATFQPLTLGVLAVVAGLSLFWARQSVAQNVGGVAAAAVPKQLSIQGKAFESEDQPLDDKTLDILETRDYLYRQFVSTDGAANVDLLIVFSPDNRKGTHPPEVCLEGGGDLVTSKAVHVIHTPRVPELSMRELVTQNGTRKTYHLYVYKCGDKYTPNFMTQQFTIFWNGLTARNAAGALIRLSVLVENSPDGLDKARQLTAAAAEALMPAIDRGLN